MGCYFETQRRQSQCFTRCFSTGSTKVDPSRQDWKIVDSDVKNQDKQTKNQMLLFWPVRLNSLIHVKSPPIGTFKIRWATPSPPIHHMLLLGVSKKTYWCLGYSTGYSTGCWKQGLDVNDAWEDPENSVWGVGCPEIFILVFFFISQRAVRTWPPFRSNWAHGVLLLPEVVNNSISKETCNKFWSSSWGANPLSPTLGTRDTCDA